MTNGQNSNAKIYDLEERTGVFGEETIRFAKKIPQTVITRPIIEQFVKSGTSIGANYCEADCAETKKDFEHKIGICKKESKETKHWLRMIIVATPELKDEAIKLQKEVNELVLIFSAIVNKSKAKIKEF
ncbi:MAG: four helix bundle protein [Candidatus Doudnabacteria bacterium RIFCSPLOWO2_02_FULL_48_8]|uniref:Four helix bundle protein n=1 Tax=Candidatus Doudnabacteria bacterium RIFCSPHIGHO2_01_FULL_46_24 TaxID=1817825 RepID=A0A1F5NTD6_9BACT|nr:MAG: four helix bundle protein [Candidatus Doudnabacteria bacterium RIFCSPHIGHO2_01_FULL_46_24]OGE95128.1 MAG: four helix bundle protein [Candidatus Doudnabacteria bacterium RIFCSPLOWO2_02_FULL_48_8]OGE95716.1 MAG: four helix bundle protein [Candidatus Doudnabacteria bacterium RIFCSPHIGHO2_12_FULL_48_11]